MAFSEIKGGRGGSRKAKQVAVEDSAAGEKECVRERC